MALNKLGLSAAGLVVMAVTLIMDPVQAGIMLTIESKSMLAGSSDTLDVFVSKETGDPDWNVVFAQYSILITPGPGAVGSLEFDPVQPDDESTMPDPGYLFGPFAPTGNFSGLPNGAFQYDGGDFTNDIADFATIGSGNLLLARLNVSHILPFMTPPAAAGGSTYTISLIDANTDFLDDTLNSVAFNSTPGLITISSAAAVPEPSSLAILVSGAAWLGARRRRRCGSRATGLH